ncbi:sigma-70 family RNA polymerase sigma factor [Actinoplanes couchii]|uniref:sigma-70 family RNA polymerase sigma factor n=1 Tax=Actinoplanes couchii TaxID=403638 RepID=UPI001EF2C80B|nr:sigma-70 family RNA polymerase sigma factor [Actinoplanes couchii]MDR6322398.1 RNA polymerase sigma factor (sigma-70 family) [Actinoplanes couchii]
MPESRTAVVHAVPGLVRDAQRGDTGARDRLFADHLPLVYDVVGRTLPGHPDVDDLVQDTMLQAINGLAGLRDPERFRSWLVAIAYRRVQAHLRTQRTARRRRHHAEPVDLPDPDGDFAERTTAEMVVTGQRRELAEATRWLEDADRELLGLWWQEARGDLSRAELADALGLRPNHAAVRVQRMKSRLELARGVVRALRARPICPELSSTIRFWDGTVDSVWRKRLSRHVRDCPKCHVYQAGMVSPERLLLGTVALPVPVALWAGIRTAAEAGVAPPVVAVGRTLPWKAVAAMVTVAAGGGLIFAVLHDPAAPPAPVAIDPPVASAPARPSPTVGASVSPAAERTERVAGNATGSRIVVAPDGSDDGDGSLSHPYRTIKKAVDLVKPGQSIVLRGGTHRPTSTIEIDTDGSGDNRITISGYDGEQAVIDASGIPAGQWAIVQRGSHWTVRDLEVTGARAATWTCLACVDNVFQRLNLHDNAGVGLMLRDPGTAGNQVLDNDFRANQGSGLSVQFGSGDGNLVRGNRASGNARDGIDLGAFQSRVALEYNWSYRNGGNGFALGGGDQKLHATHHLRHNAAWLNAGAGFTDEGNTAGIELGNNTAYDNEGLGFAFRTAPAVMRNNVAIDNGRGEQSLSTAASQNNNSWQEPGVTLRSTDPAEAEGARNARGGLPGTAFLQTGNGMGASMAGSS